VPLNGHLCLFFCLRENIRQGDMSAYQFATAYQTKYFRLSYFGLIRLNQLKKETKGEREN
jgi:hypothetical protein